jgi:peptidoglycan/LPS O-acetylase OafA/YrhL
MGLSTTELVADGASERPDVTPPRYQPLCARHLPALDGIRGLAIIWVVFHNTLADNFAPSSGPLHIVALLARPGWIGVQLFFALSGFLITAGLLDSQASDNYFSGFYAKRALRILPLYYAVLLLVLVIFPSVAGEPHVAFRDQASLWLFVSNWTHVAPNGFGHFWSLGVEEQFYLFWPLIVYRLHPQRLLAMCLWIAFGALLVRCGMRWGGASSWTIYTATPCRMDALGLGAAGACLVRLPSLHDQVRRRLPLLGGATFALFLLGMPATGLYDDSRVAGETFGYTILAWCSAAMVTGVAMTDGRTPSWLSRALRWRPLRSCGKYSYAMYVFHQLLHKLVSVPWIARHFGPQPSARVVFVASLATLVVSYALAFVSYHGFEKYFLSLKRLVQPSALRVRPAGPT